MNPLRSRPAAPRRLLAEQDGAAATEYAVLLALVLLVAFVTIQTHGVWLAEKYASMKAAMFG